MKPGTVVTLMFLAGLLHGLCGTVAASTNELVTVDGNAINVIIPDSYDPAEPMPLVVLLHGFTSNSGWVNLYFRLNAQVDSKGFIYASPNGTPDPNGDRFWNATDACCDVYGVGADHVDYLSTLVETVSDQWSVDPRRIYFMGHSNGGYMSFRMACDRADMVAAIVSLNGGTFKKKNDCQPSEPVHILQIHGTEDTTVLYEGGAHVGVPYPGAVETVQHWAGYNGCSMQQSSGPNLNLVATLAGAETTVSRYDTECDDGGSAELWTMLGAVHSPLLSSDFAPTVVDWALGKVKPHSEEPDAVGFNAGFNDAWRNPVKKGGQGILLVVLPEIEHIFLAWFTYDMNEPPDDIDYTVGHPSQRWYTAFGPYNGDTAVLDLELNSNGIFDSATPFEQVVDGTITVKTNGCDEIFVSYDITSANASGDIAMGRVTSDNIVACESLDDDNVAKASSAPYSEGPTQKADEGMTFNAGLNDAWRNPEKKGGQGVLAVVLPTLKSIFMAWFTYEAQQPDDGIANTIGHPSQRWYTAFGPFEGDTAVLDLELNSNGIFDSNTVQQQVTDGTVTLKVIDCEEMMLSYDILSAGLQGDIPLGRVTGDNVARCNSLATQ